MKNITTAISEHSLHILRHIFFGCLGSKIKFFDFGYSFRLFLTFPLQASNLQSPTVFLFMVMEVKMKLEVCYWQKGTEVSASVIALGKNQT